MLTESAAYIRTEPKEELANKSDHVPAPPQSAELQPIESSDHTKQTNTIVDYDQLRHYFKVIILTLYVCFFILFKVCYRAATTAHMKLVFSRHFAELSHEVIKFAVYEPGKNPYHFKRGEESEVIEMADDEGNLTGQLEGSPLEAFFKLCRKESDARQYTLLEACAFYICESKSVDDRKVFVWRKRKNVRHWQICRIYPVKPREAERFALRLLVIHVKGPTSYEYLRTIKGRQQPCATFAEAARLLGILDDQTVWERTLREASSFLSPQQMRDLFVQV